jgi:hypothetical protein
MHDSVVSAPGREPAPVQMCMDILYTTSSAQSARELSLRRYSSVTMCTATHDARCVMVPAARRNSIPRTMPCVCSCDRRLCERVRYALYRSDSNLGARDAVSRAPPGAPLAPGAPRPPRPGPAGRDTWDLSPRNGPARRLFHEALRSDDRTRSVVRRQVAWSVRNLSVSRWVRAHAHSRAAARPLRDRCAPYRRT